jgi:hypothetical protein
MKRLLLLFFIFILPINLYSSELIFTSSPQDRFRGFYVTILSTKRSNFPLSYDQNFKVTYTNSSSPSYALAIGVSSPFKQILYADFEFEYARSNFSDYRISNRKLNFFNLIIDAGLFLPMPAFPFALCGTVGFGWVHQSEHADDDWMSQGWEYEYHSKGFETFMYGFSIKCSVIKNIILEFEIRTLREVHRMAGEEVPGRPGWYYEDIEMTKLGKRVSFGFTYIFSSKMGYLPWK